MRACFRAYSHESQQPQHPNVATSSKEKKKDHRKCILVSGIYHHTMTSSEGHLPLNIFLVNETDRTLEFCDPKCEWGQEGTPMVKHDRRVVEPNQSCLVFAKEGEFLLGSSPFGPKGEFSMRFADSPDDKFTIHYNHQMLGKTSVEVHSPEGYLHFVSKEQHLQEPHASAVIHLVRRPHTAELEKELRAKGMKKLER